MVNTLKKERTRYISYLKDELKDDGDPRYAMEISRSVSDAKIALMKQRSDDYFYNYLDHKEYKIYKNPVTGGLVCDFAYKNKTYKADLSNIEDLYFECMIFETDKDDMVIRWDEPVHVRHYDELSVDNIKDAINEFIALDQQIIMSADK